MKNEDLTPMFLRMAGAERAAMGKNARKYYDKNLSMDAGVQSFENIFFRVGSG